MKKFVTILCLLTGLLATLPAAETTATPKSPPPKTDTVVWAGLDYSMVRMIGPGEFSNPETIFPGMLEAWNNLFLQERIIFVEKQIKKNVITDIGGVMEANKAATSKQIINSPGPDDTIEKSHITAQDIAKAVKSYKMEKRADWERCSLWTGWSNRTRKARERCMWFTSTSPPGKCCSRSAKSAMQPVSVSAITGSG